MLALLSRPGQRTEHPPDGRGCALRTGSRDDLGFPAQLVTAGLRADEYGVRHKGSQSVGHGATRSRFQWWHGGSAGTTARRRAPRSPRCAKVGTPVRSEAGAVRTGTWPSLVGHLTGGQGVAGSNPAVPTEVAGQRPYHQPGEWPQDLLTAP